MGFLVSRAAIEGQLYLDLGDGGPARVDYGAADGSGLGEGDGRERQKRYQEKTMDGE